MKQYINYFLNYLQTEKDAAESTICKYKAVFNIEIYSEQQSGVKPIKFAF